ncbi:hypothetical protein XELAEV_18034556mg, partial [Xenopus laevis]
PICTDLKTSSHFDNFCDFARFRCFHMLHYVKRIPCEEQEQQTIQTPTATPAKDPSLKSQLPQEITTETKPAGVTDKVQYKPMKIKPVTVGYKTTASIKAQSQQQTTPQKKTVGPKLGVDVSKLQTNVMASLKYKNDPVNGQDKAEMLAKPRDEASTRIPCEEQEQQTILTPTATPAKDPSLKSQLPQEITTETKPAGVTDKVQYKPMKIKPVTVGYKTTESIKAQSQQQTTPQKKTVGPKLGVDVSKLQANVMPSLKYKNDPVNVQDKAEMLAKPRDEASTMSHNPATSIPESTRIQGTEYPKEYQTANDEQNMTEEPEPQDSELAKRKITVKEKQDFKAMDIDETSEESDSDDDIIGFVRPKNPPSSGHETTVTHKPTKAPSHQREMAKVENVKTQQDSYEHKKLNKLEMAWANMIENPANIKGTTRKPQDIEVTSEDSDRDNDIIGFAGLQNPPKSGEETIKGIHKTTKAPSHQRAMAKVESIKTQQHSYGHKKLNKLEMAWANMIENPANIKGTTRKPQDIEETSEDSDRDNDIIGFAGSQNPPE